MQRGFAPILIVVLIAAAAGGYFWFNYSNNQTKPAQNVQLTQTPTPTIKPESTSSAAPADIKSGQNIINVNLSVENGSNKIAFLAKKAGSIYMPKSAYWYPNGSWQIYGFVDNKWKRVILSSNCSTSCDTVCKTGPLACVAGGPSAVCQSASSEETFEWNRQYVNNQNKVCGINTTYNCSQKTAAKSGKYKVVFIYKTDCRENDLFGEKPLVAEKEFELQ